MANSWADAIEYGSMSFYMTHLLVMNICTKYEKDPSSGRNVTAWTWFHCPIFCEITSNGPWRYGSRSIYKTHLLSAVNICTKYEKDPSRKGKLWSGHDFIYRQAGGRTNKWNQYAPHNFVGKVYENVAIHRQKVLSFNWGLYFNLMTPSHQYRNPPFWR